jgi:SAM-dependent methyltransferase
MPKDVEGIQMGEVGTRIGVEVIPRTTTNVKNLIPHTINTFGGNDSKKDGAGASELSPTVSFDRSKVTLERLDRPYDIDVEVGLTHGTYFGDLIIWIPGRDKWDDAVKELEDLDANTFRTEPYDQYARHLLMIAHFGYADYINQLFPIMMERLAVDPDWLQERFPGSRPWQARDLLMGATADCVNKALSDDSFTLEPHAVDELYNQGIKDSPWMIVQALVIDERNKVQGNGVDIQERVKDEFVDELLNFEVIPTRNGAIDRQSLSSAPLLQTIRLLSLESPNMLMDFTKAALVKTQSQEQIVSILQITMPWIGLEKLRKSLREYVEVTPEFQSKFDSIFEYIGLDQGAKVAIDLGRDVYAQSDVSEENYRPYQQTKEHEVDLIADKFKDYEKILDVGCGTGRLLIPILQKMQKNIAGFDAYEKDIAGIKVQYPNADVRVGTWFDIPFPDESFDGLYCLGRSFSHNITIPDAIACLSQMRIVLKKDGKIITDLPDPTKGEYKKHIDRTLQIAKDKGLKNVLPGLINDSPDGEHFFDRYAPDASVFTAIAELAGLEAKQISSTDYDGKNGERNTNVYWELTVTNPAEDLLRIEELLNTIEGRGNTRYADKSSVRRDIKRYTKSG